MYHHVRRLLANADATWRNLTVTPEAFEAQIKYLADNGYHTIYFADLAAYFNAGAPLPAKPIILTFDDGWIEQYTIVYPILRRYCLVGTFFPPVNWVNNGDGKQVISWAMIEEMSRGGMEFGSHTLNHHLLSRLTEKQIMEQLVGSKAQLEKHTTRPVVALAYPGGASNKLAVSLVPQAGYSAAVGIIAGVEQARADLFLLHRITIPYSADLKTFEARIRSKRPPTASPPRPAIPLAPRSLAWPDRWADLADR
jgi:peptidoglycan/xylan/chitin deacetylase (PgdA/CDA1 family)